MREQLAMYEHGSRCLFLSPDVPARTLVKAIGHELAHGAEDWSEETGQPHIFSSTPAWKTIHQQARVFDIDKYRDQGLEYFADQLVKTLLLGYTRLMTTNGHEANFMAVVVIPTLMRIFA